MEGRPSAEIWAALVAGGDLSRLGLPRIDGRYDLRSIDAPEPTTGVPTVVGGWEVAPLGNLIQLRGVTWNDLDFRGAKLESLRFHGCSLRNCRFDDAECRDWRVWDSTFIDCTFASTDLRDSALGGVDGGRRNQFRDVVFRETDLRGTAYVAGEMLRCKFVDCRLEKVDFQGMNFTECVFEGALREVVFHRRAFRGEAHPPNEMRAVDFRRASLRAVEFRGLDMDDVLWPVGPDHYVVDDFPRTLDRLIAEWGARSELSFRGQAAFYGVVRKWVGPNQRMGIVSRADLLGGGEEVVEDFLRLAGPSLIQQDARTEASPRIPSDRGSTAEHRAREIAEAFLQGHAGTNPMRTGRAVETRRSWLFATEAVGGELLLGNAPIVVDKTSGVARFDGSVEREFVDEVSLSSLQRMKRWVARRWQY